MTPPQLALLAIIAGTASFLLLFWLLTWLLIRLSAERCPRCGSKWQTEALGEWDGCAAWQCHCCAKYWTVFYFKDHRHG